MSEALEMDLSQRLPTPEEAERAKSAVRALAMMSDNSGALALRVRQNGDGESVVELPPAVSQMVLSLLMHIGKGEAVTFVPYGAQLTTQQAADLLNVSRPFLIKLLESKAIPYHKVGSHRRVMASDVLDYKRNRHEERAATLDELARLGQEIEK